MFYILESKLTNIFTLSGADNSRCENKLVRFEVRTLRNGFKKVFYRRGSDDVDLITIEKCSE